MPATIRVVDGRTVIRVGENVAEAARMAGVAVAAADESAASAAFAEAFVGPVYADVAAGEAATTEGQIFRVSNGDGPPETTTAYRRTTGGSVELDPLATTSALASTDTGKGAGMVGLPQGGTVANAIRWVVPEAHGAVGDAVKDPITGLWSGTDDSAAFQAAIDYLASIGGGMLLCQSNYVVGGILIESENIVIQGNSRCNKLVVKSGTTGFTIKEDWVHFRHIGLVSEGTRDDGLGTNGVLYAKDSGSIGHIYNYDVDFGSLSAESGAPGGFSGVGCEFRNALDLTMISVFHYKCKTGLKFSRNGTGPADFTTTTRLINVYVIGCTDYGIDAEYVYRSEFNVIAEYNGVGIRNNIGDITLNRCYFENNTTGGALLTDTGGQDINNYSHASAGVNTVTRTRNVTANSDWYTSGQERGDFYTKRLGIQTSWGRDTEYISGHGTTDTVGLRFGTATLAMKRGPNLLDPTAWEGDNGGTGGGTEFKGWVASKGGYEVSGSASGGRGMRQSVTLTEGQTYVLDYKVRNVTGGAFSIFRVGSQNVVNGVPFTAETGGANIVLLRAAVSGAFENIAEAVSLAQVDTADATLIADIQDRLSRLPAGRGAPPASSAPTYPMAAGEFVPNSAGTVDANNMLLFGWYRTASGTTVPLYASTVSSAT